jgi:DnaJ like chaperone protein
LSSADDASVDEIEAAYRRLAKDYHPDRVATLAEGGFREYAHSRMREIREAYEML